MPGSSATRTRSAGPPSGAGPDSATATARAPVRSSPASANPVTSHPAGGGHGAQMGTRATWRTASSPSRLGRRAGHSGLTAPCMPHRHSLDQGLGGAIEPRQRGHAGVPLMVTHGTSPPKRRPRRVHAGGSNSLVRRSPAARPLAAMTRAIFRDASSIISSPSITAPRPCTRVA
jgi:hypothetical protein